MPCGRYGKEVEAYLDICLKTPGLPEEDVKKALLARSNARKLDGGQLQLDPPIRQIRNELPCKEVGFATSRSHYYDFSSTVDPLFE